MSSLPHVVVIGGGFAGLEHLFQPLLYQVATASLSPGDIATPIRWVLHRQENLNVLLADVLLAFEAAEREPDPKAQQRLLTFVIVGAGPTGVELVVLLDIPAARSPDHRRTFVAQLVNTRAALIIVSGPLSFPT